MSLPSTVREKKTTDEDRKTLKTKDDPEKKSVGVPRRVGVTLFCVDVSRTSPQSHNLRKWGWQLVLHLNKIVGHHGHKVKLLLIPCRRELALLPAIALLLLLEYVGAVSLLVLKKGRIFSIRFSGTIGTTLVFRAGYGRFVHWRLHLNRCEYCTLVFWHWQSPQAPQKQLN